MVSRTLPVRAGSFLLVALLLLTLWTRAAQAGDLLPLPRPSLSAEAAQIVAFSRLDAALVSRSCADNLKPGAFYKADEKLKAVHAYHVCRAQLALRQLASGDASRHISGNASFQQANLN